MVGTEPPASCANARIAPAFLDNSEGAINPKEVATSVGCNSFLLPWGGEDRMPRFHFDIRDGGTSGSVDCELPDIAAARTLAGQLTGQLIKDNPLSIWAVNGWRLEVSDATGVMLFVIDVVATQVPESRSPTR